MTNHQTAIRSALSKIMKVTEGTPRHICCRGKTHTIGDTALYAPNDAGAFSDFRAF